jgi:phage terminase large subunit-like protein
MQLSQQAKPKHLPKNLAALAQSQDLATLKAFKLALEGRAAEFRLARYKPYERQRFFHEAGATFRERLFRAGNQLGKTLSSASEIAVHSTGRYPDWWVGKSFRTPTTGAVASETSLLTRDGMQVHLFGYPKYPIGTGMIPKDAIVDLIPNRHVADFYDYARVKFGGGGDVQAGESLIYLRSYDQGRARIQAMTLDYFALDEEPPLDYYTEALTRTNKVLGPVWLTFTPLKGMSDVVNRFLIEKPRGSIDINMTIEDVEHYTREQKDAIIASYPSHEREARANGVPILGSGRVFAIDEALLRVEPFPIPTHWPRIAAMDFGWDHPTAAVWLAWDRDTDTVYVIDCYRVKEQPVAIHAHAMKSRGEWIPMAWPHDGNNDVAAGPNLASQYRAAGLAMLAEHAQLPEVPGGSAENTRQSRMSVEAGVQQMLDSMMGGQFKVFSHLHDWWEEFRLYHRKDGKIVKERDDLISATRYAFVSRRFAKVNPAKASRPPVNRNTSWRAA